MSGPRVACRRAATLGDFFVASGRSRIQLGEMAIRVVTLGGLHVFKDGNELTMPVQRRVRSALLVYLAIERVVNREKLLAIFWPESDEEKARHALSQSLYELRQQLGDWLGVVTDRLVVDRGIEVDAHEFARFIEDRQFEVALDLYRGPFLSNVDKLPSTKEFENWLDGRRAHYERLHRTARRHSINNLVEAGDYQAAVNAARQWVDITPLEDEAQHRLIELLSQSGHPVEAIRHYETYERLLAADDLTPLEDTRTLIGRIRAQGFGVSAPPVRVARNVPTESAFPEDLEIIRPLGEGSVATVLLAREPALRRLVAVKVLKPELAGDDVACRRFEREAQAAATITHPNITSIYRIGRLKNGGPFIVMEYIDGRTLDELLAARGPFPMDETRRVVATIAKALEAAHAKGVIHRHVAPSNVIIENNTGRAVLMDFGFAALLETGTAPASRLTRIGERIGDPLRMSPEQRAGEPVTRQSDVYAIGLLGYELLTGRLPHDDDISLKAARSDVADDFASAIGRCLAVSPRRRPDARMIAEQLSNSGSTAPSSVNSNAGHEFMRELQKRKVVRAFVGYVAAAFVVLQGAQLVLPGLPLDDLETWYRGIVALTLAGFPVALVLSWVFDWSADGIQRTRGMRLRGLGLLLAAIGLITSVLIAFGVWLLLMR